MGCDFTSILPNTQNIVNDISVVVTKQNQIKQQRSSLHCRDCDNKFTSIEALDRHYEHKTNNTGHQVILAKTFKSDGSQTISCREENCCYSCDEVAKIYSHDRANHDSKNFQDGFSSRLISVVNIVGDMATEVENYCNR